MVLGVTRLVARAAPFALPVTGLLALLLVAAGAQEYRKGPAEPEVQTTPQPNQLDLTVGKSLLLDSGLPMERISVGLGGVADVTAVSPS